MTRRVCFIRQSPYPLELSVRREVETLCRAGLETHVISLGMPGRRQSIGRSEVIDGVYVHRLPVIRKKTSIARYVYDYLSFFVLAALQVTLLHLRNPFDVIQVNTMPDFLVFSAFIPKLLGAKIVLMMYEPVPELWQTKLGSKPPGILATVEQAALRYADAVLTVTQQMKDTYVGRGADEGKITVILNVPEGRFLGLESGPVQAQPLSDRPFTLICHGAVEERYGHDTMLQAVALARSQIPSLRLRILGKGSYGSEFLEEVDRMGLQDQVQFLGWVPHAQMIEELLAADVGIVAQKSSPYSNLVHTNKMYEYIALGKPVLASRLSSVQAYFGDDALYFFEPGNAESLAQGILDLYQHPSKRRTLVENAQRIYRKCHWEVQKEIYLGVYRSLLGHPPVLPEGS
jgi:glycosyltransferase involved in cell wall biosynthesis